MSSDLITVNAGNDVQLYDRMQTAISLCWSVDDCNYKNLRDEAFGEVGVTMDRRDRKEMKEIVFLIKAPVHEQLRKAAFDKKVTMQSILRAGLKMWFIAHDYPVPDFGER